MKYALYQGRPYHAIALSHLHCLDTVFIYPGSTLPSPACVQVDVATAASHKVKAWYNMYADMVIKMCIYVYVLLVKFLFWYTQYMASLGLT